MSSLIIRKHSLKVWEHIPSDQPTPFYLSKFYVSLDDNQIRIVEQGESKRNAYSVFNVTIEVVGGGTFSGFTSASALLEKLEELGYPAFYRDGEFIFIPANYDLSEFENASADPFARLSEVPAPLGFTPENVANKATTLGSPNNTTYPTTQAVSDGLATKQNTLTNPITGTGANGQVAFFNGTNTITSDALIVWDNTNKRLAIGSSDAPQARFDIRAQGALATNIAFRVRNIADTQNFLVVNGAGDVFNRGANGGDTNTHFGENTARARTGNFNSTFGNQAGRDLTTGASNTLFGYNAGRSITTANANTFIGTRSGESNTTGNSNVAVGQEALLLNQTTLGNTAIGQGALKNNIASQNTALGSSAGTNTTTGGRNVFLGVSTGRDNTTGQRNVYAGMEVAMFNNGSSNTLLGEQSGLYLSDGVTQLTSLNNSVFIGQGTRALGNNETNQIVIGHQAIGLGSNSVVLGNSNITQTQLRGNVICGNQTVLATNATTGFLYIPTCAGVPTGTPTAITGKAPMVADSTNNRLYVYLSGAWVAMN